MFKTRITQLLGLEYPIIEGGLAYLGYAELAAAVSNAGGLGQITAAALPTPEAFREEVRRTKSLTAKPFGVNIVVGRGSMHGYVDVALEEGVKIFTITGGNPSEYMAKLEAPGVRRMVLVGGTRAARRAEDMGADAVMVVGYEGGGHIGLDDTTTLVLVPLVVDAVRIPVVAGGGISDGRGMVAALALGAEGVEMGTRFVAVRECIAHENYKASLVDGKETGTVVIKRSMSRPGRVIHNDAADHILQMEAAGATVEQLLPHIGRDANEVAIKQGNMAEGLAWVGQGMGLITDVPPAGELIARMVAQAERIGARLAPILKNN